MKKIFSFLLVLFMILGILPTSAFAVSDYEALSFPEEAITPFSDNLLKTVSSGDDYASNCGYERTGTFISPYWSCSVNEKAVDVYSSLTYDEGTGGGVLHSYSCIWIEKGSEVQINLSSEIEIQNAVILPERNYSDFEFSRNNVSFSVNDFGSFTCLINNDDMRYAFTLFVRELTDEEKEIAELKEEYGADRVLVFENGYYKAELINADNYDAVYFRRGAYISAEHIYDVNGDGDIPQAREFFLLCDRSNIKIKGYGTFDFTMLDRKERSPMFISGCNNCSVEGLCFINSGTWTLYTYACENLEISDITQFSYRTNSDGINICGSNNINVSDSFIRNGDDSFSAKTTNTYYDAHDIIFDNCIGWSTKARCFGITGEVEADIYNVTFRNSFVFNRNATWDNNRVSSLVICVECGKGQIDNILFESIDIRYDKGRAFNFLIYGKGIENCRISNIKLKDINCIGNEKPKISTRVNPSFLQKVCFVLNKILKSFGISSEKISSFCGNNHIDISLENVTLNGNKLSEKNYEKLLNAEGFIDIEFKER